MGSPPVTLRPLPSGSSAVTTVPSPTPTAVVAAAADKSMSAMSIFWIVLLAVLFVSVIIVTICYFRTNRIAQRRQEQEKQQHREQNRIRQHRREQYHQPSLALQGDSSDGHYRLSLSATAAARSSSSSRRGTLDPIQASRRRQEELASWVDQSASSMHLNSRTQLMSEVGDELQADYESYIKQQVPAIDYTDVDEGEEEDDAPREEREPQQSAQQQQTLRQSTEEDPPHQQPLDAVVAPCVVEMPEVEVGDDDDDIELETIGSQRPNEFTTSSATNRPYSLSASPFGSPTGTTPQLSTTTCSRGFSKVAVNEVLPQSRSLQSLSSAASGVFGGRFSSSREESRGDGGCDMGLGGQFMRASLVANDEMLNDQMEEEA